MDTFQYHFGITTPDWLHTLGIEALVDPETGEIDRPVTADRWWRPRSVTLVKGQGTGGADGAVLVYVPERRPDAVKAGPGLRLLERFTRLARAPATTILAFAREWGMLTLCEHAVPVGAGPLCTRRVGEGRCRPLAWQGSSGGRDTSSGPFEPVAAWRHYAAQAGAALRIAAALKRGAPGAVDDWRAAFEWAGGGGTANGAASVDPRTGALRAWPAPEPVPWWDRTLEADRTTLVDLVHEWLTLGRVGLLLAWDDDPPRVRLGGHGLFGALATQLLFAIGAAPGMVICTACGEIYTPRRRPDPRKGNYCLDCGRRAAGRLANQRYRQRQRQGAPGASLAHTGTPPSAPSVEAPGHG